MSKIEIIIGKDYEDSRIDKYMKKHYKNLKLGEIYKSIRSGKVRINGKKVKQNYRLQLNDKLTVPYEQKKNIQSNLEKISQADIKKLKSRIEYEDEEIIIINKKSNEVVHKGSRHDYGLIDLIKTVYNNNEISFVNRLDKDTSGLIIATKNIMATRKYSELIRHNMIKKKYFALVKGDIKENSFKIENAIKKAEKDMKISKENGKVSITYFNKIANDSGYSLLECELVTGRTHQIRLQLSDKGFPIVGDRRYGGERSNSLFLYSYYIEIESESLKFEKEIPEFFRRKNGS